MDESRDTRNNFFAISIILFISIVALLYSIQNLMSPGLETMSVYFGFGGDTIQLGVLTFTFTIIGGITMIFFGYLSDKLTRVRILFSGSILFSIASTLTLFVTPDYNGYLLFFVLQIFVGFGFGALIPATFSLMGDMIKEGDRAKGFSFFSIATLIGTAVGQLLGAIFVDIDWRFSYFYLGIAGIVASCLVLTLKEPNRIGRDFLYLAEGEDVEYTYRIKKEDLKVIFKKKTNIWLIINFVDTIPTGIILFLLYKYLFQVHNIPEAMGIIFLAFVLISTLVGTVIFGAVGDALFKKGKKKARVYLALIANVAPIPFVFIGLNIPFSLPNNADIGTLFVIPEAVLMLILVSAGLFINGATNGSWYATVVDINLPEHRATTLATANFFDIIGRAVGPLIGAILTDTYGIMIGINASIIFWILIPFFWIGVLKNVVPDMDETREIFKQRLEDLEK